MLPRRCVRLRRSNFRASGFLALAYLLNNLQ
jgi:hypothetical protein